MREKPFSHQERAGLIQKLQSEIWGVVVIGGGITGAAVARDASLRGLRVALVEAHDFASGTSSGSTKLIHGGLRYLENFEFGLVREALQERELLRKLYAPLVKDLKFVFPTYKNQPPPRWKLSIGLFLYDAFSNFRMPYRSLNRQAALAQLPQLNPTHLTGACVYADSFAEDYRLVTELIKSAVNLGAVCVSRLKVNEISSPSADLREMKVQDQLEPSTAFRIQAKTIVNCSGPFSDAVRAMVSLEPTLKVTQGVHFLVDRKVCPIDVAMVFPDAKLHRILFAIPWGSCVFLGTTDTSIDRPEQAQATAADLKYVLEVVNQYLAKPIQQRDVFQSWSGVRPLIQPKKNQSNSQISREHQLEEAPARVLHVLGGKLTSHRSMAEEAVDYLERYMPLKPSTTDQVPLFEESLHLPRLQDGGEKLHPDFPYLVADALYAIRFEMALSPMDFLKRRSSIFYETDINNPTHRELLKNVLNLFAQELQWSEAEKTAAWAQILKDYRFDREGYDEVTVS
jgi:glycerol-3-phosphate dehydrogenase